MNSDHRFVEINTQTPAPEPSAENPADVPVKLTTRRLCVELRRQVENCYHLEDMPNCTHQVELIWGAYWRIKDLVTLLMNKHKPHCQLPGDGQRLWRELQRAANSITVLDQSSFYQALDPFDVWLRIFSLSSSGRTPRKYEPLGNEPRGHPLDRGGIRPIDKQPVPKSRTKTTENKEHTQIRDLATLKVVVYDHLKQHLGEVTPLTQKKLAEMLSWSKSRVQRTAKLAFRNGWAGYLASFASQKKPSGYENGQRLFNSELEAFKKDDTDEEE